MKKLLLVLLLLSLSGFFQVTAQDTLTILHLNDTHSTLAPIGPRNNDLTGTQGGIARAARIIGMTKMSETNVLTLHAGDFSIGDLFYNKYFGVPELQILQSLGLDAMTVGNHEWDLTPAALLGALQNAFPTPADGFPLLSANTDLSDPSLAELKNYISPYTIKQVGNIKVGIFGMTTPITNLISQPSPAVISEDITTVAADMVTTLSSQGCDVIIFLSHLGLDLDKIIAENIPGINLIVGGHDHYLLSTPVEIINPLGQKVWIVQANSNYLDIGKVQLEVENGNVTLLNSQVIPLDESIPEEPTIKATIDYLISDIESTYGIPFYTQQAGYAAGYFNDVETNLLVEGSHDTPIGNLVTDAFRWKTGAQLAIQGGGSTALPLYEGPFVPADIYMINGYGFNTITTLGFQIAKVELSGTGLIGGLEFGLSDIESSDEYLLQVSGLEYTYDSNLPVGGRVTSAKVNGVQVDPAANYTVALNEFAILFLNAIGIPYTVLEFYSGVTEFEVLSDYIQATGPVIYPKTIGRIANVNSLAVKESVKGAGWFDSPKGAIFNNPNVEGKLFFAFIANIDKKKRLNGNVLLTFPKSLKLFTSNSVDWLTINNSTGQIKGSGKINGKGDYGFLITAISNDKKLFTDKDKIHIKVWNKSNGDALVYDNFSEQNIWGNINLIEKNKLSKETEETTNALPTEFELNQNYPNPFNPTTTFQFQIPEQNFVTLKVYDIIGNEVTTVVNEQLSIGSYKYQWNASGFASGVYIYRLQAGNFVNTKKLILMK